MASAASDAIMYMSQFKQVVPGDVPNINCSCRQQGVN